MPSKALVLSAILVASTLMAEPPRTSPPPAPEPELPETLISADRLLERLADPDLVVLDVRISTLSEKGHIPGAFGWAASDRFGGELSPSTTIVLYDLGPGPSARLAEAFWQLERSGHGPVKVLRSGFEGWKAAGGPVSSGPPRPMARAGDAEPEPGGPAVDTEWVIARFGDPGIEILDVRDGDGWRSYRHSSRFRAGHVPHSLPFSPSSLVTDAAVWPDPRSMVRELSVLGPRAREPVDLGATFVLVGAERSDPEVALGFLLFRMMGLDVRVYEDGWAGWTAYSEAPVVRVVGAPEVRWLLTGEPGAQGESSPPADVLIVDLRESWYFEQGHVPGARLVPAAECESGLESAVRHHLERSHTERLHLILYCFGPSCTRSRECGTRAARLGVRHIYWFRGGLDEWREHGYPVATGDEGRRGVVPENG